MWERERVWGKERTLEVGESRKRWKAEGAFWFPGFMGRWVKSNGLEGKEGTKDSDPLPPE